MTPQEQKMLDDLIARVDGTRLEEKDPDAAHRIEEWSRRNPDAAYILAQTVLVQNYALEQAKIQMQHLQEQVAQHPALAQPSKSTSFLGGLFGHKEDPQTQSGAAYAAPQQQPGFAPVPQYAAPQQFGQQASYPPPAYGAPQAYPPSGGGSSFLRSAATTAAGVAAGALAFQGVESLMHGFGHAAGFGGSGFGDFGGRPEETIVNNYYDSPAPGQDGSSAEIQQFAHEGDGSLNTQQDLADDVDVDSSDTQLQADTADLPDIGDGGTFDDASMDDGGSFDDSMDNS